MNENEEQLQALLAAVQSSAKYRTVSPDLIRAVGQRELATRSSWKVAVKQTKNKLHQVGGAYLGSQGGYDGALALLSEAAGSPEAFRDSCRQIMRRHSSTRERLEILDLFFSQTLAGIPRPRLVLDLACGLNPLAWSWMPFDKGTEYVVYDIYGDAIEFLNDYMTLAGINGRAEVRDVLSRPPQQPADLIFVLKSLPCLEQLDKNAGGKLLDRLQARHLLISYPVASLGGRQKGMIAAYDRHFGGIAAGRNWLVQRFEFATELAFLVETVDR